MRSTLARHLTHQPCPWQPRCPCSLYVAGVPTGAVGKPTSMEDGPC
jgi:hypothetical protein